MLYFWKLKAFKSIPWNTCTNRVSLEVRKGEVHGLCGENGAGKAL